MNPWVMVFWPGVATLPLPGVCVFLRSTWIFLGNSKAIRQEKKPAVRRRDYIARPSVLKHSSQNLWLYNVKITGFLGHVSHTNVPFNAHSGFVDSEICRATRLRNLIPPQRPLLLLRQNSFQEHRGCQEGFWFTEKNRFLRFSIQTATTED